MYFSLSPYDFILCMLTLNMCIVYETNVSEIYICFLTVCIITIYPFAVMKD